MAFTKQKAKDATARSMTARRPASRPYAGRPAERIDDTTGGGPHGLRAPREDAGSSPLGAALGRAHDANRNIGRSAPP